MMVTVFVAASSTGHPTVNGGEVGKTPSVHVVQPALAYSHDALSPEISQETIDLHFGKHQAGYVTKLNGWLQSNVDSEQLVRSAMSVAPGTSLVTALARSLPSGPARNLAGQIFNHALYFEGMRKGHPFSALREQDPLRMAIDASFGSFDALIEAFRSEASNHFGSGWTWILLNKTATRKLSVVSTHDAGTPVHPTDNSVVPLAVCDVWEHAYYVDYRNVRPKYVDAWLSVLDWSFVARRFAEATVETTSGDSSVLRTYPLF